MGTTRLANNAVVTSTASASQTINMAGANALSVQVTVLGGGNSGANTLAITAYGSDDLENWVTTGITEVQAISIANAVGGLTDVGIYTTFGYAYARLVWSVSGANNAPTVIAVDANSYVL